MTARLRRLASDWEQVKRDFQGHRHIVILPVGGEPPEQYNITYFVNGVCMLPDGRTEIRDRHEVEIILHAEYPHFKPICRIRTPIWHPNFRDGQICIGDIWGAGESLSDIIINIGDMIQYKSWNASSPLSAQAAQWAIENKHMFPVGDVSLYRADYTATAQSVDIDLFGGEEIPAEAAQPDAAFAAVSAAPAAAATSPAAGWAGPAAPKTGYAWAAAEPAGEARPSRQEPVNDFYITPEELAGIPFVPTAQRMHTVSQGDLVPRNRVNFKTVLTKGILWALVGAVLGFILQESLGTATSSVRMLRWMGHEDIAAIMEVYNNMEDESDYLEFLGLLEQYTDTGASEEELLQAVNTATRISSAVFSACIALSLGALLGVGEGVFYGSREKAARYALLGAGIAIVLGFVSGYIAQGLYASLISAEVSTAGNALVRGVGWSIMGCGVGLAVGLIKPAGKRILYCALGGLGGGFLGGFLFDFIFEAVRFGENDTGTLSRGVGIVVMGLLIGLGIGLLEQFAKQAWLKVVRGEFEGKEYLVFAGATSIGNNGKNTIVLFKDKLVGAHHCDIVLEGSRYVLTDSGSPLGTMVNGLPVTRHVLKRGDAIAVGNTVLVFQVR